MVLSDSALQAFTNIKSALSAATLLIGPHSTAPTSLSVDASATALGGVLQQYIDGQWHPLAFFSQKLSPTETRYHTFGREILAIYRAIQHFRYFLVVLSVSLRITNRCVPRFLPPLTGILLVNCDTWRSFWNSPQTSGMLKVETTWLLMLSLALTRLLRLIL